MTLNEIGQVIDFILSKWCHFYKTEKFNSFNLFFIYVLLGIKVFALNSSALI